MSDDPNDPNKTVKETQPAPISSTTPGAGEDLLRAGIMQQPDQPGMLGKIGRFDVIKLLGQGGMGQVLLAREPVTNVKVAIKVLKPQLAQDAASVHRFLTEARHAYAMGHPNILKVLEVSDSDDRPFYVVPYIEGGSLARRIGPQKPLPAATALDIARQIAGALSYAHGRGIIHRDLKPANVLMDGEGRAYLTDFGLLRTVFNDSFVDVQQSSLEGTAPYMSPAVVQGKAEDTRCDIYSFGAMLYEMLTGQPPYTAPSIEIILKKIAAGPPQPILKINPKAAKPLAAIADWAMARELRDRYATMADVLSDLERVAKGKDPVGPRGVAGLRKPTRRNLVVTGAVVAVVAMVGFAVWQTSQRRSFLGMQLLPPSLDLVKDFGSPNFVYEAYWDDRFPRITDSGDTAVPLHFFGMWKQTELYQGPAFFPAGGSFPYVAQNTNIGFLLLHPGANRGASVAVPIRASAVYDLSGAFARTSPVRLAGDGVDLAIFRDADTTNLLFGQRITADHEFKVDAPFDGTGVVPFRLRVPLNEGETVRFVVFAGPNGRIESDGTALKAVITPLSPIQDQPANPSTTPIRAVSAGGSAQNVVVNGSFEVPAINENRPMPSGSKEMPGWTVGSTGNVEIIRPDWPASDGINSIDLSGLQSGSISQDIFLTKGTGYLLFFDMAYNRALARPASLQVSVAGQSKSFTRDPAAGAPFWRRETLAFVATNTGLATLTFQDTTTGGGWSGAALDNVSLVAVSSSVNTSATVPAPPAPGRPPVAPSVPAVAPPTRSIPPRALRSDSPQARLAKVQAMFKGKVTLRPDGQFEFFYDFSDPAQLDDWIIREPQAEWAVEGGWLVCKKNASNGGTDTRLYHKALYAGREREISYDAQGPDNLGAGLFGELEDWRQGYHFDFSYSGAQTLVDGNLSRLAITNLGVLDPKRTYHISAAAKHDSYSLVLDAKEVLKGSISPSVVQTGKMAHLKLAYSPGRYDNVRIVGALDPAQYQYLFFEYFDVLSRWTGRDGGRHSGVIVPDPLSSGRGSVLTFTNLTEAGDIFSRQPLPTKGYVEISFDYLGLAKPRSVAGDLGGFVGISSSLAGNFPSPADFFFAATKENYHGSVPQIKNGEWFYGIAPLLDNGEWHRVSHRIPADGMPPIHLVIQDFAESGGVAGDVYFDNITVKLMAGPITVPVLAGPVTNAANGHLYYLLAEDTWQNSEVQAIQLGGHLVTINDKAEQDWVFSTFGSFGRTNRSLWIGLREVDVEGNYQWVSGERIGYTHWMEGEPTSRDRNANHVHIMRNGAGYPPGQWNEIQSPNTLHPQVNPICGVVEVVPSAKPVAPPPPAAPAAPKPGANADWRSLLQQADAAYAENRFAEAIPLYDVALAGMEQDRTTDATILKTMKAAAVKHRGLASFIPQRDKLPADKQIEAIQTKLRELNPNYSGKGQFIIRSGKIVEAWLFRSETPDLSPLKGLPLSRLNCAATGTHDLSPLRGMPLQDLDCGWNQVSDLTPLKDMHLTSLDFEHESGGVTDLSPLKGMALKRLNARGNAINDLSPVQGMPLEYLSVRARKGVIKDLSPLHGMPLGYLDIANCPVSDVSPIRKCPLTYLDASLTEVSDLSPLAGMPITFLPIVAPKVTDLTVVKDLPHLEKLVFEAKNTKAGWEAIRRHPNLKVIEPFGDWGSSRPAAEFWKRFDAGEFSKSALPAAPVPARPPAAPQTPANLLANGGFELEGEPAKPAQWGIFDWADGKKDIQFELSNDAHSGKRSVSISSKSGGDGCWFQTVKVEPYRNYRFSGWIKTQGIESKGGNGVHFDTAPGQGNIGVRFGREILRGSNDWHRFETVFNSLYFTKLIMAGVFGNRGAVTGKAWFDDLSLVSMKEIPRTEGRIINGSFEEAEDGWPLGWSVRTWSDWSPRFEYAKTGHTGSHSVRISAQPGRSGIWIFMAKVKRNTSFKLSGWIRTENLGGGARANLAVGVHDYFWGTGNHQPFATEGIGGTRDWTQASVTFSTGQNEWLQIACQLAGSGDTAAGDAWFDDIELQEVP